MNAQLTMMFPTDRKSKAPSWCMMLSIEATSASSCYYLFNIDKFADVAGLSILSVGDIIQGNNVYMGLFLKFIM